MAQFTKWLLARNIAGRWAPVDFLMLGALLAVIMVLLSRSGILGLRIETHEPANRAEAVSNHPTLTIEFASTVRNPEELIVTASPPVEFITSWQDTTVTLRPVKPLLPETKYKIEIGAGLEGENGQPLRRDYGWEFTTRTARIIYLGWDDQDVQQLFLYDEATGRSSQLTQSEYGILDFDHDLAGEKVVYSAVRADGGSDIWLLDIAEQTTTIRLNCAMIEPATSCQGVVWRPGYDLVAYEQRPTESVTLDGESHLYWLDISDGKTLPILNDPDFLAYGASFSSDGQWLSFVAPSDPSVRLLNLLTEQVEIRPGQAGQIARWQPGSLNLVLGDLHLLANGFALHMYQVEIGNRAVIDLSRGADIEDAGPAWSYGGEWIAFGRKAPRINQGRQIWLHNLVTSEQLQLTESYSLNHGLLSWSFDDENLLYQQFDLNQPTGRPSIWLLNVATNEQQQLISEGFQPDWLP